MPDHRRPAFRRLPTDERRRRLLELGAELFTRHGYDELSMAAIARRAGISKPLLYHYFPSKQAYFVATLEAAAADLARRTAPDPGLPPAEALRGAVAAYLAWIDEHGDAYSKLMRSAGIPEVREVVDGIRSATADRIVAGLAPGGAPPPALRAAVAGWLWFMDGACLEALARGEPSPGELLDVLMGALSGAVAAAGGPA